ncbi:hypothetical protein [Thermococcus prieurii]
MKKVVWIIAFVLILGWVYGGLMSTISSFTSTVSKNLNSPDSVKVQRMVSNSTNDVLYKPPVLEGNSTNRIGLQNGVYNLSTLNGSTTKELLDPTKWYVGNSSLSMDYATKVYNDTMKVVQNATKESQSILERFLGIFRTFGSDKGGISHMIEETLEKAKNLTKSLGRMVSG